MNGVATHIDAEINKTGENKNNIDKHMKQWKLPFIPPPS